jgi:hypothetical protein
MASSAECAIQANRCWKLAAAMRNEEAQNILKDMAERWQRLADRDRDRQKQRA